MKARSRKRIIFVFSIVCIICIGVVCKLSMRSILQVAPYGNASELVSNLYALPVPTNLSVVSDNRDWQPYIIIARRIKVSEPRIAEEALRQVPKVRSAWLPIKTMILLRVCFECPPGTERRDVVGTFISSYGPGSDAVSFSALLNRKNGSTDVNWPVARRFGRFYLQGNIGGYVGPPYDPEGEFEWLRAKGKWRTL